MITSGLLKIYCSNCGLSVDPEDNFCPGCGKELKNKPETQELELFASSFTEPESLKKTNCTELKKRLIGNFPFINMPFLVLICIFGAFLILCSTFILASDQPSYEKGPESQIQVQENKNIQICEQIAAEYYESHTYAEDDIYDCDNMAQDVWNMLKAKGINSKIAVGSFDPAIQSRIEKGKPFENQDFKNPGKIKSCSSSYICKDSGMVNSSTIDNLTHAWVMAEVSQDSWLAIECTGGYVVYSEEDENYYNCLTFNNPKDYRIFLELYRDWKKETTEYERERLYYNKLVDIFNNASYSDQVVMKSNLEIAKKRLKEKEEAFLKTNSKIVDLLQQG